VRRCNNLDFCKKNQKKLNFKQSDEIGDSIDAHRGGEGGRVRVNIGPHPEASYKTLVDKNAIKPKIGGPPWQFFWKP
jgi:hypothetical protein